MSALRLQGDLSPLYVICDADVCHRAGWSLEDFAAACIRGGARLLQLRAKEWTGGRFLDAAAAIVEHAKGAGASIVINDRADIARLSDAAGVHVGQEDMSPRAVQLVLGPGAIIGLSTHTRAQLAAAAQPVTYVAVGPVFGTHTKDTGYSAVGLDLVQFAATHQGEHRPVVAIGGITLDNCESVLNAGASSVAVITDLLATGDPESRVRQYLDRLAA